MKKEKIDLVYGSLLHAIGKVIQGSSYDERDIGTIGSEWFKRFSDNKKRELYTSLHYQQHIVFMRISKKTISKRKSSFNNV